jgi:tetratricopeptide (TPR) repeat protein
MDSRKYHTKAIELLKDQRYEAALEVLNKAIISFPESAELISERGVVNLHLQKRKDSLRDMDKAVELQPQNGYRYSSRAFVKDSFGDTEGAIIDYKKSIEIDPEDDVSFNNLGLLEEKLGYIESAKEKFAKADELSALKEGKELVGGRHDHELQGEKIEPRNIQREIDLEKRNKKGLIQQFFSVFTSKKERDSFINFVRSGFKLKE